jgi:methionyl-tRNA formyltransferase
VTKAPKLTKEHGSIDWTQPATRVCNQIRAMQPWPTAYTAWLREGQPPLRLIVTRAEARGFLPGEEGAAGTILVQGDQTRLRVVAADGVVEIAELQPAGKRKMGADEFLRGRRPSVGDRLGPEPT